MRNEGAGGVAGPRGVTPLMGADQQVYAVAQGPLAIGITVFGEVPSGQGLLRSGAQAGVNAQSENGTLRDGGELRVRA